MDAVNSPPTIANVEAGVGPSAATATASGSFTTTSGASGTVSVTSLTPATNYTVPITLCMSARILKQDAEGLLGKHVLMLLLTALQCCLVIKQGGMVDSWSCMMGQQDDAWSAMLQRHHC